MYQTPVHVLAHTVDRSTAMADAFLECCDAFQPISIAYASDVTTDGSGLADSDEAGSSCPPDVQAQPGPKRRRTFGTALARKANLKLTVPDMEPGENVSCLFFEVGKRLSTKTVGVPLWPHYAATFASEEVVYPSGHIWVSVSNSEDWLLEGVKKLVPTEYRKVTKIVADELRRDLREQIILVRGKPVDNTTADDDGEMDREFMRRKPVVQLRVGPHRVVCMNYLKMFMIKPDEFAAKYLKERISDIIARINASSTVSSPSATDASLDPSPTASSTPPRAAFTFGTSQTPNQRDKIWWVPEESAWTISISKKKEGIAPVPDTFTVKVSLGGSAYDTEKLRVYINAAKVWNEVDGSKRHRILIPLLSVSA